MPMIPYLVTYAGVAVFVVAVLARIRMFSKMPMHLRWELYPVPHEKERAQHGGSYLEEPEWWKKPRHVSKSAEMTAMGREIVFLEALHEHNRKMWWRSFPFHFGLYLTFTATVLMALGAALAHFAGGSWSAVAGAWQILIALVAAIGAGLVFLGALGLLQRRLTDPDLADFTTAADVGNLLFFIVTFGFALVTFVAFDPRFVLASEFVHNLLAGHLVPVASGAAGAMVAVTACLLATLTAYIPLTHMAHFVAKYFAYHSVRWNDEPNLPGGPREKLILANLTQKVSWAAPHIQGGGEKSWVDLATEDFSQYGEHK